MRNVLLVIAACVALAGCAWLREPVEPMKPAPPPMVVTDAHGKPVLTPTGEPMVVSLPASETGETRGQYIGRTIQENGSRYGGPIGLAAFLLGGLFANSSAPTPGASPPNPQPAKKEEKDAVA